MSQKVKPSPSLSASIALGPGNYAGFTVTGATAIGAINIRRGTVTGQIVDVIPSGTAAGATKALPILQMDGGIFVEFTAGATGTIVIHYE